MYNTYYIEVYLLYICTDKNRYLPVTIKPPRSKTTISVFATLREIKKNQFLCVRLQLIIMFKARIFMQKLLLKMHIFMYSKIKKYVKKNLYCVLKKKN